MSAAEGREPVHKLEPAAPRPEPKQVVRMLRVARREVPIDVDLELGDDLRITCRTNEGVIVDVKTYIARVDELLQDQSGQPEHIKRVFVPKLRK